MNRNLTGISLLVLVFGFNVVAHAAVVADAPRKKITLAKVSQTSIGLSPEQLKVKECATYQTTDGKRTTNLNACIKEKQDTYNTATAKQLGTLCTSVGVTDANACLMDPGNVVEAAIATFCDGSVSPSASAVATAKDACSSATAAVASACAASETELDSATKDAAAAQEALNKANARIKAAKASISNNKCSAISKLAPRHK